MVVAEQLGHTDARPVLQRYAHLYPGAAARAALALDLYLRAATVGETFSGSGSDEDEWRETPMDTDGPNRALREPRGGRAVDPALVLP